MSGSRMRTSKLNCKKIFLTALFLLTGCEFNKMSHLSSPVVVKIPWKEKGQTQYTLQNVELKTVKKLSPLEGEAANLYVKPDVYEDHIAGSLFEIEFTYTAKKEVIPLNRLSSQALTLYAHMERLYLWSRNLSLPQNLKTKLDVGLAAEFLDDGKPMRNNALFSSLLNSMLVVPYSDNSLPLSLNGGVLAHEYFHFLYNGLVLKYLREENNNSDLMSPHNEVLASVLMSPHNEVQWLGEAPFNTANLRYETSSAVTDKQTQELNEWLIFAFVRGMNEGLADVWGWLYSEDTNFIVPSLPIVEKMRDLEVKPKIIWTKSQMVSAVVTKARVREAAEALAYDLGTQYARWVYTRIAEVEGTTHLSDERRNFWSNRIIERLVSYSQKNMSLKSMDKMIPSEFITYLLFGEDKLTEEECLRWASFVEKSERSMAFSKNCATGLF